MLDEHLHRAGLRLDEAARWLDISTRTMRRYRRCSVPRVVLIALRRRNWISPEAARYLETLAYWRGVEDQQQIARCAPTACESCGACNAGSVDRGATRGAGATILPLDRLRRGSAL